MEGYFIIVYPDGAVKVQKAPEEKYQLDFLQKSVEGYIETAPCNLATDIILIVNDEGKINGSKINRLATRILGISNDFLFGNVVLGVAQGEYILPLTLDKAKLFADFLNKLGEKTKCSN